MIPRPMTGALENGVLYPVEDAMENVILYRTDRDMENGIPDSAAMTLEMTKIRQI